MQWIQAQIEDTFYYKGYLAKMDLLWDHRRSSDTYGRAAANEYDSDDAVGMASLSRSACTTPGSTHCLTSELPTITFSDSQLHDSSCQSDSAACDYPSIRRSRLERMKVDVAKLGNYFRRSGSGSAQSSKDSSPSRRSHHSPCGRSISPDSRRITVEYNGGSGSSYQSLHSDLSESADEWDAPDHNFSSSLILTSLQDGLFNAEIPLKQFPMEDLVLFVCDHELEIVIDRGGQLRNTKRRVCVPYHYGIVDLPIFVETSSLVFAKDSTRNVLLLQGRTKGYFARRRSVSFDTIPRQSNNNNAASREGAGVMWKKLMTKLGLRKSKSHGTIVEEIRVDTDRT